MKINLDIKWYQWIFGMLSSALAVLFVHDGFATFTEQEPQAIGVIALLVGGALLTTLCLTFGLRWSIRKIGRKIGRNTNQK